MYGRRGRVTFCYNSSSQAWRGEKPDGKGLYGLRWGKKIGRALEEDECWKILSDFAGWFGGNRE